MAGRRFWLAVLSVLTFGLAIAGQSPEAVSEASSAAQVVLTSTASATQTETPTMTPTLTPTATPTRTPTPTPDPDAPVTKRINIFGRRFSPGEVQVTKGSTLVWRNGDRINHNLVADIFRDRNGGIFDVSGGPTTLPRKTLSPAFGQALPARPEVPPGQNRPEPVPYSYKFDASLEGTLSYHCTIHPSMAGTIVIGSSLPAGDRPRVTVSPVVPGPPTATPTRAPRLVTIFGNRFSPSKITINQGESINFRNGDRVTHRVIGSTYRDADGGFWDWSPNPPPGSEVKPNPNVTALNASIAGRPKPVAGVPRPEVTPFTYKFDHAGTYSYRGELNSMRGLIQVVTPTPTR